MQISNNSLLTIMVQRVMLVFEELVSSLIHDSNRRFVLDALFNGYDVESIQHFWNSAH